MIRDEEINALLRECAHASGLHIVSRMNGSGGFERCDESDEISARVTATFQTFLPMPNSRPMAEMRIGYQEALDATPGQLTALVRKVVATAKADLIAQLKATLARIEASE